MKTSNILSACFMLTIELSQAIPLAEGGISDNASRVDCQGFQQASTYYSKGGKAMCVSGLISVPASTTKNVKLLFDTPANQTVVTGSFVDLFSSASTFAQQLDGGAATVGGNFTIGASYCTPLNNPSPSAVQLLTPGIGFTRDYWDFAPGYSYVDVAAENGYASVLYDRLGTGVSSAPANGINVTQAPLDVAVTTELASQLRSGQLVKPFHKVIGIGHSFGSIITQGVTQSSPDSFDAVVLTGFSANYSGVPLAVIGAGYEIASTVQPRFSKLPNSYVVTGSQVGDQVGFFRWPGYDPSFLTSYESVKAPITIGELFTQVSVVGVAENFTKPVAVVNGVNDLVFCSGNCSYPTNLAAEVKTAFYPKISASSFGSYLAPLAGHALNLHYSGPSAFVYIQNFLKGHGF